MSQSLGKGVLVVHRASMYYYMNDEHTASLGGKEISREEYLARLAEARRREARFE